MKSEQARPTIFGSINKGIQKFIFRKRDLCFFIFVCVTTITSVSRAAEVALNAAVTLSPVGNFVAKSNKIKGKAVQTGEAVSATDIRLDLNSLTTGMSLRDRHAKKYLETEKYPEAILLSANGKSGKGKGRLRLKGVERDIEGTYRIVDGRFLQAEFPIKLSEFSISGINYRGIGVKDDVKIDITVPLEVAKAK